MPLFVETDCGLRHISHPLTLVLCAAMMHRIHNVVLVEELDTTMDNLFYHLECFVF